MRKSFPVYGSPILDVCKTILQIAFYRLFDIFTMTVNGKPEYGRRLIPQILDRLALVDSDRIVYSIASFHDDKPSFRDITAREFTKAVDKTAWWLREQLLSTNGSSDGGANLLSKVQALGYIGPRK